MGMRDPADMSSTFWRRKHDYGAPWFASTPVSDRHSRSSARGRDGGQMPAKTCGHHRQCPARRARGVDHRHGGRSARADTLGRLMTRGGGARRGTAKARGVGCGLGRRSFRPLRQGEPDQIRRVTPSRDIGGGSPPDRGRMGRRVAAAGDAQLAKRDGRRARAFLRAWVAEPRRLPIHLVLSARSRRLALRADQSLGSPC